MKLELISATLRQPTWRECLDSWSKNTLREWSTRLMENDLTGQGLLESYQTAFDESEADILLFIHDDLIMHDTLWNMRLLHEFKDPKVGMVGFAGALGHGTDDLYTSPYKLSNMARQGFRSNMVDAEKHGERFSGACDVSVLDGMALAIRRSVLLDMGGFPLDSVIGYYMYSEHLCCMTRRLGYRIRLLGCYCEHLSGKSTGLNPNLKLAFEAEHEFIWNEFRDVLPGRV
jgi:GT2 family glycosyltransferase